MPLEGGSAISAPAETNVLQNFSDATAGRSQQLFYCLATTDSGGVDYILSRDSGVSKPIVTGDNLTPIAFDIDFDITINKPTIIAGIASIDLTFDTGVAVNADVEFKLIHYDGSTETEIGTVTTETVPTNTSITTKVNFSVTRKLFGIGDILRLTAIVNTDAAVLCNLHHDAQTAGNELKLWVPIVNLE